MTAYHFGKTVGQVRLQEDEIDIANAEGVGVTDLLQSCPDDDVATVRNCLRPHMVAISAQQAAHPVDADKGEDGF
jgi:hypothetical protein